MHHSPIFYDPKGRRRRQVSLAAIILSVLGILIGTVFVISLFTNIPLLKAEKRTHKSFVQQALDADKKRALALLDIEKNNLANIKNREAKPAAAKLKPAKTIVAGFLQPYLGDLALSSLRNHAKNLTHLMPGWLKLNANGTLNDDDFDLSHSSDVQDIATANGIQLMPILVNMENGVVDTKRANLVLDDPATQKKVIDALVKFLVENKLQGVNLDFEKLDHDHYGKYVQFMRSLRTAFAPHNFQICVDLEADKILLEKGESSAERMPLKEIGDVCDFVIVMAYDEHSDKDVGAIAGVDWTEDVISQATDEIPAQKVVMGIGNYAYDWIKGGAAESISYQAALQLAKDNRDEDKPEDVVNMDPQDQDKKTTLNNYFDYEDDNHKSHTVWMLDAVSAFNQWTVTHDYGIRGAALWQLGNEDPSIWQFLSPTGLSKKFDPKRLQKVSFPYEVEYEGNGEVLHVESQPHEGSRTLDIDKKSGLIVDCNYHSYPASYLIRHSGFIPKKLALTFDDGPDATYTPDILDILKENKVKATFFVIGENAEKRPNLVKRIFAEGHEIGSHTFTHPDMGNVSDRRATFEMNATQRAIQTILGRSTILFRPPYNADSEPNNPEQVKPVIRAADFGYVTIGEKIDPQDWDTNGRTAQDMIDDLMKLVAQNQTDESQGNVILLHDSGGDRSRTVALLKVVIPKLKAQGYEFVTCSQLMGTTRDKVMPLANTRTVEMTFDRFAFWFWFTTDAVLALAFVIAIGLGIARILMITPLAISHTRRRRSFVADPTFRPSVTALIAAYNEEKVIVRTIESVLHSHYAIEEVVVVDDGSKDGTGDAVAQRFAHDPRVRLVRQENAGKAAALNNAISEAKGEVLFCIDADTQLDPDAIGLLVRHFQDPKIAAVAGNVKVGNRVNLLTWWQSIEYITSQNMDRKAYARLNAITVVPGAIGAWRHSAVEEVGGFVSDTLAEDMDLTWRLRRAGYKLDTENDAIAYTEAPDTLPGFFKQRFRWAYGTLQCLWKHRRAIGHNGWFGAFALPSLWVFQIVFQALAPLIDLQLLFCLYGYIVTFLLPGSHEVDSVQQALRSLEQVLALYALFFGIEFGAGLIAYRMDKENPKGLWGLFFQRFVYRQIMYGVIYKSVATALRGLRQGWGKIDRKATVTFRSHAPVVAEPKPEPEPDEEPVSRP